MLESACGNPDCQAHWKAFDVLLYLVLATTALPDSISFESSR